MTGSLHVRLRWTIVIEAIPVLTMSAAVSCAVLSDWAYSTWYADIPELADPMMTPCLPCHGRGLLY